MDELERERTISAEEEVRIAAVAFETQEGMLITDARGIILRVNQAFTRLTGYAPVEVIGRSLDLLFSGRHDAAFHERMWQALREKGDWQGETWHRYKNGKIHAEWLTLAAVRSEAGVVSHYVGNFTGINANAEAAIHYLAYCDPLTHLPNRSLLLDRLSQALSSSARSGRHGAVLFLDLDLDSLKTLNDSRGLALGDALLVEVAQRLQRVVREGDTISRLDETISRMGGDEFVLLLENLGLEATGAAAQARRVAEKVREALSQSYDLDGLEYRCAAHLGVTLFCGREVSVDGLLKQAGLALYRAREEGCDGLCFFDPAMQAALDERNALMADLRWALQRGQFQLYYQAQVDAGGRVIGAEALLRWLHPQHGLVPPGDFMPLAEETGLILPIGLWALEAACVQIRNWSQTLATRELRLSVNLSARQFRQVDFVAEVEQILYATGADPSRLRIEVGGSMVLDDVNDAYAKMHALKSLGIGFSLDDFGVGNSSLSYLTRLPLDQVKINRAFIHGLPEQRNDAIIVKTIIAMAAGLGLSVIAEGVESEAQRAFLASHHCHAYQGYLFSRPLPLLEFEAFLGGGCARGASNES